MGIRIVRLGSPRKPVRLRLERFAGLLGVFPSRNSPRGISMMSGFPISAQREPLKQGQSSHDDRSWSFSKGSSVWK
jgi:hypothetical protein